LARQKFHAALNASPDFDVAINTLAGCMRKWESCSELSTSFTEPTYVNPNNIRALSNIAVAYQRINKLDASRKLPE